MDLKKAAPGHQGFFLFAAAFEARAIWEYVLSREIRLFLIESSVSLLFLVIPSLLETAMTLLDAAEGRRRVAGTVALLLLFFLTAAFWWRHPGDWVLLLNLFVAPFLLLVLWGDRLFPEGDGSSQARRLKAENLFADRAAFQRKRQRRVKITVAIFALILALIAKGCWSLFSRSFLVLPVLMGVGVLELVLLVVLFKKQIPWSDEEFEERLARAKARFARSEARRAKYAARRAQRAVRRAEDAERLRERKEHQQPSKPSGKSFTLFIYWSVIISVGWLRDRSHWEKPDLAFCAVPAWYLVRTVYLLIRQRTLPKGPGAPPLSEPSATTLD